MYDWRGVVEVPMGRIVIEMVFQSGRVQKKRVAHAGERQS